MTKVIFYDVGHGSCCHIITPNGKHILVDIGTRTDKSVVEHIKQNHLSNANKVDALIITHPHEDHIRDLQKLNEELPPKALLRNEGAFELDEDKDPDFKELAEEANDMHRRYSHPVPPDESPLNKEVNGGVTFTVIAPKNEWTDKSDLNTFSYVIVMEYGTSKFVLTGDNPSPILQKMMDENYKGIEDLVQDATILLAPHHGRENGFCQDFFDAVNPILSVISDKEIEHSTQEESSSLYKGIGSEIEGKYRYVLTTRYDGNITFEITETDCTVYLGEEDY